MQITHKDALADTPKLYRNTSSRWPMMHPDTGEIIELPSSRSITTDFSDLTLSGTLKVSPRPYSEATRIRSAYITLLSYPECGWDWYGHLTFKKEKHPEAADKIFREWVHLINQFSFGKRYWNRRKTDGVIWSRSSEYQLRGVVHYHFLMSRVSCVVKRQYMQYLWESVAGYARISPFEAGKGAEEYICKTAARGGEIDFGGPLSLLHDKLPDL
jgi:hypothetical protein